MFNSLRWRIQIWHAVILATVIVVFASVMYVQQRQSRFQTIDNELSAAVEVLVGKLQAAPPSALQSFLFGDEYEPRNRRFDPRQDGRFQDLQKLDNDLHVPNTFAPRQTHRTDEAPYFVIWRADGVEVKASSLTPVPLPPSIHEDFLDNHQQRFRDRQEFREAYAPGPPGTYVLTGRSIRADLDDLNNLMWLLVGTGLVVFLLGLAGGWVLSRNSVRQNRR